MTRSHAQAVPWTLGKAGRRFWIGETLRRAWSWLISLPDRGTAAKPLPPEFFRFPYF